nr:hypothetical protein [Phytohabitans flavus]
MGLGDGRDDRQAETGPSVRARPSRPRAKRAKIRSRSSGSIPGPVSRTASSTRPCSALADSSIRSSAPVNWTAFWASCMSAWVSRCRSAKIVTSATSPSRQSRSPRATALAYTSCIISAMSTRSSWRKSGCSARASMSRSSTIRFIRSSSSVTSATVSARSAGSSPISSRWPRTIVIGVRSSCPASATNAFCAANALSSRPSIALNVRARSATSSVAVTSIRRDRSVSSMTRAVSVTWRSGRSARPIAR